MGEQRFEELKTPILLCFITLCYTLHLKNKGSRINELPLFVQFRSQGNCKMIDYKYSDIKGITVKEFYENELLDFRSPVSLKTGEINPIDFENNGKGYQPKDEKVAKYRKNKFIITNERYLNHSGSLHKYFTNDTNHTDFTFPNLFTVIRRLYEKLHINPFTDVLHNVEFGVNVTLPFDTKIFLDAIICLKGEPYEPHTYKGRGYLLKFTFDQYEVKIYDKGFQYQLPENLLRFEIKVTTMHFIRSKGIPIYNSTDLLSQSIHNQLGAILTDYFNQLVICDSRTLHTVKPKERLILSDGQNPKYWKNLKKINPENYKKKLKRFREIVKSYDKNRLQETVSNLIKNKWETLIKIDPPELQTVNDFLLQINPKTFPEITAHQKVNIPQFNTSTRILKQGIVEFGERRFCKSCKRDITNQKQGSLFCSERIYGRDAKRCRNLDSNPRNNFKHREAKIQSGGLLFEIDSYLTANFVSLKNTMKYNAIQTRREREPGR